MKDLKKFINFLENKLCEILNDPIKIINVGDMSKSPYILQSQSSSFFIKTLSVNEVEIFEAERDGLQELSLNSIINTPKCYLVDTFEDLSFIVLEKLDFYEGNDKDWFLMGEQLARLHRMKQNYFGWHRINTIGLSKQFNTKNGNWIDFYREERLKIQFDMAEKNGLKLSEKKCLLSEFPKLFINHEVYPSILHGDLWGGNAAFVSKNNPILFDPACYYGDREVDIAMTELFGGFPPGFYKGYESVLPLNSGYKKRKDLYNLYHILNHYNIFGVGYELQVKEIVGKICNYL